MLFFDKYVKLNPNIKKVETTEEFLARGGQVTTLEEKESVKRKKRKAKTKTGIDAQALLDAAMGTDKEQEVINFLKTQGIEVN